jgi:hypothetical protein
MINLYVLQHFRDTSPVVVHAYGSAGDESCGVFNVPSPIDGTNLRIIASSGDGWEHVSVARANRCPNWPEMHHIKRLFFRSDECVVQFHPPEADYINLHPYCLHLWRPLDVVLPTPPSFMV